MSIPASCLESAYGQIETDRPAYRPLDSVTVRITGRDPADALAYVRVCDPDQAVYGEWQVPLVDNRAELTFTAGGKLGAHYLYLLWPGETRNRGKWSRYTNFEVDAQTGLDVPGADLDWIYDFCRARMRLGRRDYHTPTGRFVGYISGDTWHFDGVWLRDWIYQLPAYRFWEREMTCGLERFLERQREDGMILDGIERSGHTWRVGLESDVEYILVLGIYATWQATGDDAWLRAALDKAEKALAYVQSAPIHWDAARQLVKRQHSCDTWDYDIDGATDKGEGRHVIATCDQSGYYRAFVLMGQMHAALGSPEAAQAWQERAAGYQARANALLWDGVKYQHHVHIDPIEHAGFDERAQLAMGNTWAMTRGLADGAQARSIIDEYQRRWAATGDAYPWWSLQPGYPDQLNYWKDAYRLQGAYANGGLMPWVGGELCRAAFQNGREAFGAALLRGFGEHLRSTGGAHVWYYPDGQPGFRTTNEVNYTGWGMAEWVNALFEGLAGVEDAASLYRSVRVSPRWAALGVQQAAVCVRYAVSEGYFAYRCAGQPGGLSIQFTSSGQQAAFHVLLPAGCRPQSVRLDGQAIEWREVAVDGSAYADFNCPLRGVQQVVIE